MTSPAAVKITETKRELSHWVPAYTFTVALFGAGIIVLALSNLPQDLLGLSLFALLAAISELSNVELFRNSHANVSVSIIIAIASILVLGPFGVVLVQTAGGVMTGVRMLIGQRQGRGNQRASWVRQSIFNVGMFVCAGFASGWVFVWSGGVSGEIAFSLDFIPLVLAVSAYVIINLALLMGVIVLQTGRSPIEIWGQDFSWGVPINILGGILGGGALALAYQSLSVLGLLVFFLPVLTISYSFRLYTKNMRGVIDQLEEMNRDLDEANIGLLHALGAVIDAYDVYTYGHSTQVAIYAKALGEQLGRPKKELDLLFKAGLIHDVGKIGINDTIISKQGPLTDEEYDLVKRHTLIGADIVSQMKGLHEIVALVKYHHERWDGKGYPEGLSAEAIPLGARILSLADSLDTMFSDRPYRQTMNFAEIIEEVRRSSGTHFDPQVVRAFLDLVQKRGDAFFKNSAAAVDKSIRENGFENFGHTLRYMKKGMISDH